MDANCSFGSEYLIEAETAQLFQGNEKLNELYILQIIDEIMQNAKPPKEIEIVEKRPQT